MYSKLAMEFYGELLTKVDSPIKFQSTKSEKIASWWNSPLTGLILGLPVAAGAGYGLGKWHTGAKEDWDKLKYGLAGLGVGLSAPVLYNVLAKGGGLKAFADQLGATEYNPPAYSDFTSI